MYCSQQCDDDDADINNNGLFVLAAKKAGLVQYYTIK